MNSRDRGLVGVKRALDRPAPGRRQPVHHPVESLRRVRLEHPRVGRNAHDLQRDVPVGPQPQFRRSLDEVRRSVVGHPRIPERQHPVEHRRPFAADDDRRVRPLGRLRPRPDAVEVHVIARVGRLVGGPDGLDRLDPLAHHRHPGARIGAVVGHLLAVPARPDAELEPPAGQVVDAGRLLRGDDRVALDHQADARPDPQPRGSRRRRGQRDEQVERVDIALRQRLAARIGRVLDRHVGVLGEEQRLVSAFLGQPGDVAGPDRVMGGKDRYAEFHSDHCPQPAPSMRRWSAFWRQNRRLTAISRRVPGELPDLAAQLPRPGGQSR